MPLINIVYRTRQCIKCQSHTCTNTHTHVYVYEPHQLCTYVYVCVCCDLQWSQQRSFVACALWHVAHGWLPRVVPSSFVSDFSGTLFTRTNNAVESFVVISHLHFVLEKCMRALNINWWAFFLQVSRLSTRPLECVNFLPIYGSVNCSGNLLL